MIKNIDKDSRETRGICSNNSMMHCHYGEEYCSTERSGSTAGRYEIVERGTSRAEVSIGRCSSWKAERAIKSRSFYPCSKRYKKFIESGPVPDVAMLGAFLIGHSVLDL